MVSIVNGLSPTILPVSVLLTSYVFGYLVIFGPNLITTALHSVDTYGGILLFTGMTVYDTQMAIYRYQVLGLFTQFLFRYKK